MPGKPSDGIAILSADRQALCEFPQLHSAGERPCKNYFFYFFKKISFQTSGDIKRVINWVIKQKRRGAPNEKSIHYFSLLFFFTGLAFSQTSLEKGTFSINGNISFTSNYEETSDFNNLTFIFDPRFDYFVIDNLSLGLMLNYQFSSFANTSRSMKGIGPSVRYYLDIENIKPFLGAGYLYADEATSIIYNNIIINAGADYFLTNNVALETILSYTFMNIKYPESLNEYYPDLSTSRRSLSIGIGINVFLH